MKIFASSGDEGGGGIEVPDPQSGGGGGMDTAALIQQQMQAQPQRDAIAQAVMAQQAQQAMQAQQSRGSPYGDFAQYFQPQSAPSGSPTDVGWMNALMPWQGGVTTGGQPGTPPSGGAPFTGGGSMAQANPNYWMGGGAGRGMTPKVAGYDDSWIGGGPGYAADPGTGNQGAPGSSGFADRGVFGPEDARGFPTDYAAPQHSAAYYADVAKNESALNAPHSNQIQDYSATSLPGLIGLYGTDYSTPSRGVVGDPFSAFTGPNYGAIAEEALNQAAAAEQAENPGIGNEGPDD
jgi:hypothetical protein